MISAGQRAMDDDDLNIQILNVVALRNRFEELSKTAQNDTEAWDSTAAQLPRAIKGLKESFGDCTALISCIKDGDEAMCAVEGADLVQKRTAEFLEKLANGETKDDLEFHIEQEDTNERSKALSMTALKMAVARQSAVKASQSLVATYMNTFDSKGAAAAHEEHEKDLEDADADEVYAQTLARAFEIADKEYSRRTKSEAAIAKALRVQYSEYETRLKNGVKSTEIREEIDKITNHVDQTVAHEAFALANSTYVDSWRLASLNATLTAKMQEAYDQEYHQLYRSAKDMGTKNTELQELNARYKSNQYTVVQKTTVPMRRSVHAIALDEGTTLKGTVCVPRSTEQTTFDKSLSAILDAVETGAEPVTVLDEAAIKNMTTAFWDSRTMPTTAGYKKTGLVQFTMIEFNVLKNATTTKEAAHNCDENSRILEVWFASALQFMGTPATCSTLAMLQLQSAAPVVLTGMFSDIVARENVTRHFRDSAFPFAFDKKKGVVQSTATIFQVVKVLEDVMSPLEPVAKSADVGTQDWVYDGHVITKEDMKQQLDNLDAAWSRAVASVRLQLRTIKPIRSDEDLQVYEQAGSVVESLVLERIKDVTVVEDPAFLRANEVNPSIVDRYRDFFFGRVHNTSLEPAWSELRSARHVLAQMQERLDQGVDVALEPGMQAEIARRTVEVDLLGKYLGVPVDLESCFQDPVKRVAATKKKKKKEGDEEETAAAYVERVEKQWDTLQRGAYAELGSIAETEEFNAEQKQLASVLQEDVDALRRLATHQDRAVGAAAKILVERYKELKKRVLAAKQGEPGTIVEVSSVADEISAMQKKKEQAKAEIMAKAQARAATFEGKLASLKTRVDRLANKTKELLDMKNVFLPSKVGRLLNAAADELADVRKLNVGLTMQQKLDQETEETRVTRLLHALTVYQKTANHNAKRRPKGLDNAGASTTAAAAASTDDNDDDDGDDNDGDGDDNGDDGDDGDDGDGDDDGDDGDDGGNNDGGNNDDGDDNDDGDNDGDDNDDGDGPVLMTGLANLALLDMSTQAVSVVKPVKLLDADEVAGDDDAGDGLGGGACPHPYAGCVRRLLTRVLLSDPTLTRQQCFQRISQGNLGPNCMGACSADLQVMRRMRRNRRYLALVKGQVYGLYPMLI